MGLPKDWNSGGSNMAYGQGVPSIRDVLSPLYGLADLTELRAILPTERFAGMLARIRATNGQQLEYKWSATSTLVDDGILVISPVEAPTAGRWLCIDKYVDIKLAVDFTKADAAVLYTVPANFVLQLDNPWWEVTTSFTGGASSAIGLSSSNAGLTTKGDVLGGAGGDVAATLVSTGAFAKGTKGTKIGTPAGLLVGGDTVRFDRITSAFTAGAGFAHVTVKVASAP